MNVKSLISAVGLTLLLTFVLLFSNHIPLLYAQPELAEPEIPCNVSGFISSDTTWSSATCDWYVVTGNIVVEENVTLTVEAGTVVKFNSDKAMTVNGKLLALGAEVAPVVFTSSAVDPEAGDWGYILFTDSSMDNPDCDTSGSLLQYSVIEYAGSIGNYGAIHTENSSLCIDHSNVRFNHNDGLSVHMGSTPAYITDNVIAQNRLRGVYIRESSGAAIISDNSIVGNGTGVGAYSELLTISNNEIAENSAGGIIVGVYGSPCDCLIDSNLIQGNATSGNGGGINFSWDPYSVTVSNNTIINNSAGGKGGGIYFPADTNDIYLVSNNTIVNNSAGENGGGIYSAASNAQTDGNIIVGNVAQNGGGIYLERGGTVTNNVITRNSASPGANGRGGGIHVDYLYGYGEAVITGNDICNNRDAYDSDVYNSVPAGYPNIMAEMNYWETTDANEVEYHVWHYVDDVNKSIVDFTPFATTPNSGDPDVCEPPMELYNDTSYDVQYADWAGFEHVDAYGGGYRATSTAGQYMAFRTPVTDTVGIITYRGPDQGKLQISVDGVAETVDLYTPGSNYQHTITYAGLPLTSHTIVVAATGEKNPSSTGVEVRIDGFQTGEISVDDKHPNVVYPSWSGRSLPYALGGSVRLTNKANVMVKFQVIGTHFTWITARCPNCGQVEVLANDQPITYIDLYASSWEFQHEEVIGWLPPGINQVTIRTLVPNKIVVFDAYTVQ